MSEKPIVDIQENDILRIYPDVLEILLCDRTTNKNIFWATNDYEHKGGAYKYNSEISVTAITGRNGRVIKPRVLKTKEEQTERAKGMAEVFTPSWICNAQNNLVDEAWFGRKDVFNIEDSANKTWQAVATKIEFPEGKTWQDYVCSTRLEITCGEAPYIASRYDATTGNFIPLQERVGLLDRKLRIVSENVDDKAEWIEWARKAYQNIYAYEWQGDNLLLAREAILITFVEYYQDKFGQAPDLEHIKDIAYIISWNVWQMDGLKCVVPNSCQNEVKVNLTLFGEEVEKEVCEGCRKGGVNKHNGTYCKIIDWSVKDSTGNYGKKIEFRKLLK